MASIKKSANDTLLELIQPTPIAIESDEDNDTSAKVLEKNDEDEFDLPLYSSNLRKRTAQTLDDDERYMGKKILRKKLKHDSVDLENKLEEGNYDHDDDKTDESDQDEDEDIDDDDDDDDDEYDNYSEAEENYGDNSLVSSDNNGVMESVQYISKGIQEDKAKGIGVRNQIAIWDNLLQCRIKMQKCLQNSNCIPKLNKFVSLKNKGGIELQQSIDDTTNGISKLLKKFIEFQEIMLDKCPETINFDKKLEVEESDEEINSDTEEENEKGEEKDENNTILSQIKDSMKFKGNNLNQFEEIIRQHHEKYSTYRNNVIDKWNDKTRVIIGHVSNKDFSGFEQSTTKQVEQVLSNRQRLLDRTRLKRSNFKIIGETYNETLNDHNPEIFDDGDFYQQLLRELIERKAADVTDPIELGKQWLEIQKIRSKRKRQIDARASKGRRLKYKEHKKLVSLLAPEDYLSVKDTKQLYKSIFTL